MWLLEKQKHDIKELWWIIHHAKIWALAQHSKREREKSSLCTNFFTTLMFTANEQNMAQPPIYLAPISSTSDVLYLHWAINKLSSFWGKKNHVTNALWNRKQAGFLKWKISLYKWWFVIHWVRGSRTFFLKGVTFQQGVWRQLVGAEGRLWASWLESRAEASPHWAPAWADRSLHEPFCPLPPSTMTTHGIGTLGEALGACCV